MTVGTADGGAQSFNIDDISTIVFTIDSGVDTPATELGGLTISSQGAMVTISGPSEIEYMAADTSGRIHFAGKADERIVLDFGPLPAGIYIIRANSSIFNISIRPDYQNVTGDVSVRITGQSHNRRRPFVRFRLLRPEPSEPPLLLSGHNQRRRDFDDSLGQLRQSVES